MDSAQRYRPWLSASWRVLPRSGLSCSAPMREGRRRKWSDVDLMVVMDDVPNHHDATVAILRKLSDLPVSKDIVVTTPERLEERSRMVGTVHRAAMRDGKTVYARQG